MKIIIDITPLTQKGTGIKEYTFNIVKNILDIDKENEYLLYSWGKIDKDAINDLKKYNNCGLKIINIPGFLLFLRDKIKFLLGGLMAPRADIFFSPDFTLPLCVKAKKKFVVIHDLAFIIYPDFFPKKTNIFLEKIKYSVKTADKVIADSLNTKKDIIKYLDVKEEKIDVIYCGISKEFENLEKREEATKTKEKYNLKNYILSVGTIQPRKNFIKLIEAFLMIKDAFPDLCLVIAGNKGWLYNEVLKKANELKLNKKIIFTGFISQEEKLNLYRGAEAFVLPSFYEGFGIPVLEAFACKIPVLCSDNSSLKEVAGPAAIMFNPDSALDMAEKITGVLRGNALRDDLIKKGQERLKMFSWKTSAQKILEIFKYANRN